jgi:hypothetical protein
MIWYGVIWHEDMAWICSLGRGRDGAADGENRSERVEVDAGRRREWKGGSGWAEASGSGRAGVEGRRQEWKGGSEWAEAGVKGGSGRAEAGVKGRKWMGER